MSWIRICFVIAIIECLSFHQGFAQQQSLDDGDHESPESMSVNVLILRHPSFGSFYSGNGGGSITVELDGTRTSEGDIVLMSSGNAIAPAVFEVRCAPFSMIQLFRDSYFILRSSNGSTVKAKIISTNPSFPFVSPANSAQGFTVTASVQLELEAGQTLAPGAYSGGFQTSWITE
jgi:hypothetical protein